jgi:Fe-S oxidoreductase
VKQVLVACPNCYRTFRQYGNELSVQTIYETIQSVGRTGTGSAPAYVTVHDACTARFDENLQKVIREIIRQSDLNIKEMPHSGRKTICCGEGGGVSYLKPEFAGKWATARKKESKGIQTIVYCEGCSLFLGSHMPTMHILDLILEPHDKMMWKITKAVPLIRYLNRLRLKRKIKKSIVATLGRERLFSP